MKAAPPKKTKAFAGTLFRRLPHNGQPTLFLMGDVAVRLVSQSKQPNRVRALVTARGVQPSAGDILTIKVGQNLQLSYQVDRFTVRFGAGKGFAVLSHHTLFFETL
jgi:hypothetical protein